MYIGEAYLYLIFSPKIYKFIISKIAMQASWYTCTYMLIFICFPLSPPHCTYFYEKNNRKGFNTNLRTVAQVSWFCNAYNVPPLSKE